MIGPTLVHGFQFVPCPLVAKLEHVAAGTIWQAPAVPQNWPYSQAPGCASVVLHVSAAPRRHSPVPVSQIVAEGQSALLLHFVMQTWNSSEQIADDPVVVPPAQSTSLEHLQILLLSEALIASQWLAFWGQSAEPVHSRTHTPALG